MLLISICELIVSPLCLNYFYLFLFIGGKFKNGLIFKKSINAIPYIIKTKENT